MKNLLFYLRKLKVKIVYKGRHRTTHQRGGKAKSSDKSYKINMILMMYKKIWKFLLLHLFF